MKAKNTEQQLFGKRVTQLCRWNVHQTQLVFTFHGHELKRECQNRKQLN